MKYLIFMIFISFSGLVAAELPIYELSIKDHRFQPDTIEIPAGTKVKLLVKNLDATPEEF